MYFLQTGPWPPMWLEELVNQPLFFLRLLDDVLFVVLAQRTGELVVVHLLPVLLQTPQVGQLCGRFDLERA